MYDIFIILFSIHGHGHSWYLRMSIFLLYLCAVGIDNIYIYISYIIYGCWPVARDHNIKTLITQNSNYSILSQNICIIIILSVDLKNNLHVHNNNIISLWLYDIIAEKLCIYQFIDHKSIKIIKFWTQVLDNWLFKCFIFLWFNSIIIIQIWH